MLVYESTLWQTVGIGANFTGQIDEPETLVQHVPALNLATETTGIYILVKT